LTGGVGGIGGPLLTDDVEEWLEDDEELLEEELLL
jgi:hypothetical protein